MRIAAALALLLATASVLSVAEGAAPPPKKASVQEINDQFAAKILKSIAGHENEPAEKVFMDIRIERLKNVPAAQFINIMNHGYAKALGVTCTHCHVETDFSASPAAIECLSCDGGGGGGGYYPPPPPPPAPPAPGLYLTKAHFVQDFEGWLKGAPEFEAHILGQMPVRCDEPAWSLWGISLAGWNLLASVVMGGSCLAAFSRLRRPSPRGGMRQRIA